MTKRTAQIRIVIEGPKMIGKTCLAHLLGGQLQAQGHIVTIQDHYDGSLTGPDNVMDDKAARRFTTPRVIQIITTTDAALIGQKIWRGE